MGGRAPRGQQPLAQVDHLLVLRGRRGRRGAEVQRGAQPVLCRLHIGGAAIWGVPSRNQGLWRGQGREPVSAAALRGAVICPGVRTKAEG